MLRPRPRHHRSRDRRVGGTGRRSRRPSTARPPRPRRPGGTPCTRPVAGTEGETPGAKSPPWRLSPNMWDPRDTGEVDRIESPRAPVAPVALIASSRRGSFAPRAAGSRSSSPAGRGPSSATPTPPPSGTFATDRRGLIHVTVPTTSGRRKRPEITIHRSSTLLTSQTTLRRSIPVTTAARTLADIRKLIPADGCERARSRAVDQHLEPPRAAGAAGPAAARALHRWTSSGPRPASSSRWTTSDAWPPRDLRIGPGARRLAAGPRLQGCAVHLAAPS